MGVTYLKPKKERENNSSQNTNTDDNSLSIQKRGIKTRKKQNGVNE